MSQVVERAVLDARTLEAAGFPALMIENFGDAPFFAETVPAVTVAAVTAVANEVRRVVDLPFGVNILRNDGLAAVAVAAAVGAGFIRVNVLSGTMNTDQGPIVGRAAEVARARTALAPHLLVLADVFVKHAVPPAGLTIEQAAVDTWERGGAHALVVSGAGTGAPTDPEHARRIRRVVPDAPIVIGSGATAESLAGLSGVVDSIIVGTSIKAGGRATSPVDPVRASAFISAAQAAGWV
jgi:membrane complex biogenesis BtpA family protein